MSIDLNLINNDNLKPRGEVRLERVAASPYPDRQRVKVDIAITPFRERPNLEIMILDAKNRRVASTSVIAAMSFALGLVMHVRGLADPTGDYTLKVILYYEDLASPQDQCDEHFSIAPITGDTENPPID